MDAERVARCDPSLAARPTPGVRLGRWADKTFKYWALAPALVLLFGFHLYPLLSLLRLAVSHVSFVGNHVTITFAAMENLRTLANDWIAAAAIKNSLVFVSVAVSVEMVVGFALAILASGLGPGARHYRVVMMLPILVAPVAIGSMWRHLYNFDFGLVNRSMTLLHLPPQAWLGSIWLALPAVIAVDIWHWVPLVFLVCLAGLETLPGDILEASRVDGASWWRMLRHIVLPLVWPALSVVLLLRIIGALRVFDEIVLLTSGGPGTATTVLSWYIYQVSFVESRLGYGAMLSIVAILIALGFLAAYNRAKPSHAGAG